MQRYQLRCECGTDIPVSRGQAGGEVTCDTCGRRMPVPMLRELGQLPVAESETVDKAGPRRWTVRQALMSGGIVVALVAWAFAGWIVSATRMEYDSERMRFEISQAPFARVYSAWKSLEMAGVERDETVGEHHAKNVDRVGKSSATTLTVVGGVGLLIALVGAFAVREPREGSSA